LDFPPADLLFFLVKRSVFWAGTIAA